MLNFTSNILKPLRKWLRRRVLFHLDNDPKHSVKKTVPKEFLKKEFF